MCVQLKPGAKFGEKGKILEKASMGYRAKRQIWNINWGWIFATVIYSALFSFGVVVAIIVLSNI